jgi:DNA mismatch endonuclease (patch repair protein)
VCGPIFDRFTEMRRYSNKPLPSFRRPNAGRSRNMQAIHSSGNMSTEMRLASLLRKNRIRGWRRHHGDILGKPDFFLGQRRLAIFVDGCFFHGCPRCGHVPKTNKSYWAAKIARNKARDLSVSRKLRKKGIRVVRIWECQLRKSPGRCVSRILRYSEARD